MTAHPKIVPHHRRAALLRLRLPAAVPDLPRGRRRPASWSPSRDVEVPGPTMMHDFNLTERFVVFMDLPIVFDLEAGHRRQPMPYRWDAAYGARLGVLRRDDPHGDVRWFEIEPCYVFHAAQRPRRRRPDRRSTSSRYRGAASSTRPADAVARARALALDDRPRRPGRAEQQLDDRPGEFPRVDDRLTGLPRPGLDHARCPTRRTATGSGALTVYDLEAGTGRPTASAPGGYPARRCSPRPTTAGRAGLAARLRVRRGPRRQRPGHPRRDGPRAGPGGHRPPARCGCPTGSTAAGSRQTETLRP